METIALRTRLKAGREAEYDQVHAVIPAELDAALRAAGVRAWRIWRDGQDLFHLVEVVDYQAMLRALEKHPADVAWQARMAELLETPDDGSGNARVLPMVWELP
ncbi:L-rhamnose mutarotase [Micromonospora sp. WMMD882]|uniref:L-rhamnose mutarotase n=1 Tax=Micromonospora sp. WMMD882 TaxID=3015151 RepID=UPI00248A9469|nr:L-rhamnose mutarotase [Micromonospora sp. WMMD882]WBB80907.1 L-rhamnose mutarotase [Micromonospora sp. WMMD882]